MGRKGDKTKTLIKHTKRRAKERYGLHLKEEDIKNIVNLIQKQKAEYILTESLRVTWWIVHYLGKELKVLYDKKRKTLITVLPLDNNKFSWWD